MPGGFSTCTISLIYEPSVDWTIMRPGNEVRIWDGGNILWEGRVEDPGTITSRSGSAFDVVCTGHIAKLIDDQIFRACFVDSRLGAWEDIDAVKDYVRRNDETDRNHLDDANNRFDTNCEYFNRSIFEDDDPDTPSNRMVIASIKGNGYTTYSSCRKVYKFLAGQAGRNDIEDPAVITEKIRRINLDYELDLDSTGFWRAEIITRSSYKGTGNYIDDVFVRQCGYPRVGPHIGADWADGDRIETNCIIDFDGVNGNPKPTRFLVMRLVHARPNDTGSEGTGMTLEDGETPANRYAEYDKRFKFRINKMRVIGVSDSPITVASVFEYVAAPLFNNFISDDYKNDDWADVSLGLDHFVEDGPVDRASVLARVNMVDQWDYAVWDWGNFYYSNPDKEQNRTGMNRYVSSYSDPACVWNVSLNYTDYLNEVLVRYTDFGGEIKELIYPSNDDGYQVASVTRPLSGITRRGSLDVPSDGVCTKEFAEKIARRYLKERSTPMVTGTVEVSAPIRTQSGAMIEPWRIRAGQYISNSDIVGFGGTAMKIIQVDVNLAMGTATLTLGRKKASKIDELFARMTVQNRGRWRKNKLA